MRPRWRRRLLVAGAVMAVLALTAAGLRTVQAATTDPADPVEELLGHIADGHGEAVLDHAEVDSPLVLDRVLAEGYTPPEGLRTTEVAYGDADGGTGRPDRNAATVHVEYDIEAETHTAHVRVARENTGWVRHWKITDPGTLLGELAVDSGHLDRVRVAGAEIDTAPPDTDTYAATAVPALPGTYTLATADDETLFVADDALGEITVPGAGSGPATARITAEDLTVREGLSEEVADQVEAHLDECARAETLTPPGCPLRLESTPARSTGDVSWRILDMPEIGLVASGAEVLHGAPLGVETITPGTAEVEWTYAYTDDDPETDTVDVTVAGTVAIDGDGTPVWIP